MPTNYPNSAPARKPWERPASAAFAPPNPGAPAREAATTGTASTTAGEPASSATSTSATSRSAAATQNAERAAAPTPGPQRPQQAPADVIAPPSESVSPLLAPRRRPRRRTRGLLIAITAFVLVVAGSVAAGAWAIGSMSSTTATSSRPNTPAATHTGEHAPTAAAPTADPTDPCPDTTNGKVTTGDDEGDVVGGAEVIKRFNFAYYTWRSGIRAHEVVAPDAQVGSVADLEAGIKTIPAGTTFCLSVTDRGEGLWAVELAHNTPNPADRRVWFQLVQTVDNDGRTWIVSIDTDKRKGLSSP